MDIKEQGSVNQESADLKVSFSTFACPKWDLSTIIDMAVRYKYHGVEFRCDAGHRHGLEVTAGREGRQRARYLLDDQKIKPCCLATSLQCTSPDVKEEAESRIELAAELGVPGIRVFFGPVPEEMTLRQAVDQVAHNLHDLATAASTSGVEVWLETHDTAALAADAVQAVRLAKHRGVRVLYDNLHPFRRGETLEQTFSSLKGDGLLRYVHLHDGLNDPKHVIIKPMGKGEMPMDAIFQSLVNIGYDAFIGGEWFYDVYGDDPAEAIESYRREIESLALRHGVELG